VVIKRYETDFRRLTESEIETLTKLGPALLSDAMKGAQTLSGAIRPLAAGTRVAGRARTVASYDDNSAVCVALPLMKKGDIMVIDANAGTDFAVWGDITALEAVKREIGGVVIDGVIRDSAAIRAMSLPLFCRGATPRGPGPFRQGLIDGAVRVGGVTVRPGDVIVGDDDGVVAIPLGDLEKVIENARAKEKVEAKYIAAVNSGGSLAKARGLPEATVAAGPARA